jgi:hypothetical protein
MVWANGTLVSSDQENKVFSWSPDYKAHLVRGDPHTSNVTLLVADATHLYTASVDGTIKRSGKVAAGEGEHTFEY